MSVADHPDVILHVLKYKDGAYVKVDDSSGPMSTGGYPYRVDSVDKATSWTDVGKAFDYARMFKNEIEQALHPIRIQYTVLPKILVPPLWRECNHHCIETSESTSPEAKHFLDCPIVRRGRNR